MNARLAIAFGVAAGLAAACNSFIIEPACTRDEDCPQRGQLCFLDGCGDPGKDIVLEVTHQGLAQDAPVNDLRPTYNPSLERPPRLEGTITSNASGGTTPYTGLATFRLVGKSKLLPGISRRAMPTLQVEAGHYSFPMSTGDFELVVSPRSPDVPLLYAGIHELLPGQVIGVSNLAIPAPSSLLRISGTLLKTQLLGPLAGMDLQVVGPPNDRPLTPKLFVSDTGDFALLAPPPPPGQNNAIRLLASPRDGTQTATSPIVPQRFFNLPALPGSYILEMGDFGLTVSAGGTVNGPNGMGVPGATISLTGVAEGGGTFKSPAVQTTEQGTFILRSLPTPPGSAHKLWVIPPPASRAGILVADAYVPLLGGPLSTGPFTCPGRVPVHGTVARPDGKPAAGVRVKAEPLEPVDGAPPPQVQFSVDTDLNGEFTLAVDPGLYRLDFDTTDKLPRLSRLVQVRAVPLPDGSGPATVEVPAITLWNGRTVSGTVTGYPPGVDTPAPLANATVRFYRVSYEAGGRATSSLLAEGVTDPEGRYSVVLPTAPPETGTDAGTPDAG